jgi:hypothetical protein
VEEGGGLGSRGARLVRVGFCSSGRVAQQIQFNWRLEDVCCMVMLGPGVARSTGRQAPVALAGESCS